jgi:hypothetical protein
MIEAEILARLDRLEAKLDRIDAILEVVHMQRQEAAAEHGQSVLEAMRYYGEFEKTLPRFETMAPQALATRLEALLRSAAVIADILKNKLA